MVSPTPHTSLSLPVRTVLLGKAVPFRGDDEPSAIAKAPVNGPVAVGRLGLAGDEQADLTVHGGVDKAIHHYPLDHYDWWRGALGDHPLLAESGAFGENISTLGLTEAEVCLGDRFRLGTALVEVSQGRQPCWKLGHHFARAEVTAMVVTSHRSGWYYRVVEAGEVAAGNQLELVERSLPHWPIERLFGLLISGGGKRQPEALRAIAALEVLAAPWRKRAQDLLG